MIINKVPEVKRLSMREKLMLAEELFAETAYSDYDVIENDEHRKILESRWQHYLEHPETASTWEEVKKRIREISSG